LSRGYKEGIDPREMPGASRTQNLFGLLMLLDQVTPDANTGLWIRTTVIKNTWFPDRPREDGQPARKRARNSQTVLNYLAFLDNEGWIRWPKRYRRVSLTGPDGNAYWYSGVSVRYANEVAGLPVAEWLAHNCCEWTSLQSLPKDQIDVLAIFVPGADFDASYALRGPHSRK